MNKNEYVLGVLGGMGTYATINLFEKYAELFPADKEWDRPRIIIDNNCTMPSRVRAILYNERRDELVRKMSDSMLNLLRCGASQIILGCNTSHVFLKDIYKDYPEIEDKIINIIDECINDLVKRDVTSVYLLATEGTILSKVYQEKLERVGIVCKTPNEGEFDRLRMCIEAVKTNKYDDNVKSVFLDFLGRDSTCILGCTELPILYDKFEKDILETMRDNLIIDPLHLALKKAYKCYSQWNK